MARITVEDCITKVQSSFELVLLAAQRAKDINSGVPITVESDHDKDAVIALREIADDKVQVDSLREELIARLQTRNKIDYIDREDLHIEEISHIEDFDYNPDSSDAYVSDAPSDIDSLDSGDSILFDDIPDENK